MALPAELLAIFLRDFAIFLSIYLITALSLNLEYGYGGIPNFGKVVAVAVGAFTAGFLPGRLVAWLFNIGTAEYSGILDYGTLDFHVTIVAEVNKILASNILLSLAIFFVTIAIAALVGAVLGYVASYPAIKLREDYLAIMLLAMGEAIRVIGLNYPPIIRGNIGALVPDIFGWAGDLRYIVVLVFTGGVCLAVFLFLERLIRTPLGRMLRATRDNEYVAESLGKDVTRTRMKIIVLASMIGAIAGALDAFKAGGVIATMYHRETWTFWPWVMVILGGAGNNKGVVVGAFAFTGLRRFIDFSKSYLDPFVPFSVVWLDPLLLGVMLILILMYRPGGLIPEKPTPTLERTKLEKMASSKPDESARTENSGNGG